MMDALLIIVVAVAATYLTCFFNTYLKKGVVLASSLVTIIGGIGLPFLFPSDGLFLAGVAACGSYVAMISKERFNGRFDLLFLGLFVGILSSLSHHVFVGVGGRLGAIAAVSSISWLGMKGIGRFVREKMNTERAQMNQQKGHQSQL